VISVEADIDNFTAAKLNFEEYEKNTGRKIELIHAAVWSDNNGVEFFMDSGMGSAVSCYSGERETKAKIQSYTLSSLAELYNLEHVDFIKCDIEGAETVIFNDSIFFNKYSPRIIVEFHEFVKPHGAKNITINTLIRQGYICTPVIQRGIESAGETLLECVTNKYLRETIKNFREMSETLSRFVGKRLQKINSGMVAGVYRIFEAVLRRIMGNDAAAIAFIKYTYLFDDVYYRHSTDALSSNLESIQHYIKYGAHENKNPCAWFDGKIYLDCYIDVKESGMNPFYHYCRYGFFEGRTAGILF
jgi:FkbM family methyltransferase